MASGLSPFTPGRWRRIGAALTLVSAVSARRLGLRMHCPRVMWPTTSHGSPPLPATCWSPRRLSHPYANAAGRSALFRTAGQTGGSKPPGPGPRTAPFTSGRADSQPVGSCSLPVILRARTASERWTGLVRRSRSRATSNGARRPIPRSAPARPEAVAFGPTELRLRGPLLPRRPGRGPHGPLGRRSPQPGGRSTKG
jgi:hypothetical protein